VTPQKQLIAQKKYFAISHGILGDTSKIFDSTKEALLDLSWHP
jgi:hypothetical protein